MKEQRCVSESLFKQYELELKRKKAGEISVITDTKLLIG